MNKKALLIAMALLVSTDASADSGRFPLTTPPSANVSVKPEDQPIYKFDAVELLDCPTDKPNLMLVVYTQQNTRFRNLGVCEKSYKITKTLLKDIANAFLDSKNNQDYAIVRIDAVVGE